MMATIRIPKSKKSEYVTICITPLRCSGGGKKFRPPPEEGASRLPNTGSASAYPCAGDIIARFVEFGKMGEKPRRGDSVPPSCHCEEGQSPDVAIRPPPSQSAALTAPPQGEPSWG